MAVVKYGSVVTEIKGKVGGWVFQKCGQSLSLRANPSKFQNNNSRSFKTRYNFSYLAYIWSQLSASARATFSDNASSYPTFDIWGNPIVLSGYQLFIWLNRTYQLYNGGSITTCVPYQNVAASLLSFGAYNKAANTFNVYLDSELLPDHVLLVYISDLLPANSISVPVQYRFVAKLFSDEVLTWNIFTYLHNYWQGVERIGQNFYIMIVELDLTTGIHSGNIDSIEVIG